MTPSPCPLPRGARESGSKNTIFRRSEALQKLENYAPVINEHLALVCWYPQNTAKKHWELELDAFRKTLRRVKASKMTRPNFNLEMITDTLKDALEENVDKDLFLIGLEGHGIIAPEKPDWEKLYLSMSEYAQSIMA